MSNEKEVKNINELTETQKAIQERAKEIVAILNKEPAMELMPFIRFSNKNGSMWPDVRLEIKNEPKTDGANKPSEDGSGADEPAPAPDAQ